METSALQHGAVVDRYTIEGTVGQGGMAKVLRVRHNQLGTIHALKVLTIVGSSSIRDRLVQEGRVQATLRHANVVAVTDLVTLEDGSPGLIMEYIEGPSLEQLMHLGPLDLHQVDELARGILSGVDEAHRHGLVHRDLKPANILMEPGDGTYVPKVADFGLAKILSGDGSGSHTRTGSSMGTPQYMSPEQVRDSKNVGPAADVFALGAILYEMITHQRAFDGEDVLEIFNAVAACRYVPVQQLVPNVPPAMVQAIDAALQVDDDDRPPSVEALLALWNEGREPLGTSAAFPGISRNVSLNPSGEAWSQGPSTLDQAPEGRRPAAPTIPSNPENPQPPVVADSGVSTRTVALAGGGVLLGMVGVAMLALAAIGAVAWIALAQPEGDPTVQVAPALADGTPQPQAAEAVVVEPSEDPSALTEVAEPPTGNPEEPAPAVQEPAPSTGEAPVPVADPVEDPVAAPEDPEDPKDPEDPSGQGDPEDPEGEEPVDMASAPSPEPEIPELTVFLSSDLVAERRKGVMNLANRRDREAWLLLGRVVREDRDTGIRRFAWETTKRMWARKAGDVEILEEIVGWQLAKGRVQLAVEAADVMAKHGDREDLMLEGLRRNAPAVQVATLKALLEMRRRVDFGPAVQAEVQRLAESPQSRLRETAIVVRDKL